MGLDLYHYRATLVPSRPGDVNILQESLLNADALETLGFRRYLQPFQYIDYPRRIVAVKDEHTLTFLKEQGCWHCEEGVEIVMGLPDLFPMIVSKIEERLGLDGNTRSISHNTMWTAKTGHRTLYHQDKGNTLNLDIWEPTEKILKEMQRFPPHGHPPIHFVDIGYPVTVPYLGLYMEEIGYQRKGMSPDFYDQFGSPTWHVRRSVVEKAASLLDLSGEPEKDREIQDRFSSQFLDNFDEGTSIFEVGW